MNDKQMTVVRLIETLEGCKLKAYRDSIGIWTIGIGTVKRPDGSKIKEGDTCTKEQAYEWVNAHLSKNIYPIVDKLQNQFLFNDRIYASLCSLAYNIGSSLSGPSIITALKDANMSELAQAFRKYVKAGDKIIQGLVNRRESEIKFFMEVPEW